MLTIHMGEYLDTNALATFPKGLSINRFDITAWVGISTAKRNRYREIRIGIPGPTGLANPGTVGIVMAVSAKKMVIRAQPEPMFTDDRVMSSTFRIMTTNTIVVAKTIIVKAIRMTAAAFFRYIINAVRSEIDMENIRSFFVRTG